MAARSATPPDRVAVAEVLWMQAGICSRQGDKRRELSLVRQLVEQHRADEAPPTRARVGVALFALVALFLRFDQKGEAVRAASELRQRFESETHAVVITELAEPVRRSGRQLMKAGLDAEAELMFNCLERTRDLEDEELALLRARSRIDRGACLARLGRTEEAIQSYEASLLEGAASARAYDEIGKSGSSAPRQVVAAAIARAVALDSIGEKAEAVRILDELIRTWQTADSSEAENMVALVRVVRDSWAD